MDNSGKWVKCFHEYIVTQVVLGRFLVGALEQPFSQVISHNRVLCFYQQTLLCVKYNKEERKLPAPS